MRRKASAPRNNAARQAVRCIVIATVCLFVSGSALLQPARSVCVASERFIIIIIIISVVVIQRLLLKCHWAKENFKTLYKVMKYRKKQCSAAGGKQCKLVTWRKMNDQATLDDAECLWRSDAGRQSVPDATNKARWSPIVTILLKTEKETHALSYEVRLDCPPIYPRQLWLFRKRQTCQTNVDMAETP